MLYQSNTVSWTLWEKGVEHDAIIFLLLSVIFYYNVIIITIITAIFLTVTSSKSHTLGYMMTIITSIMVNDGSGNGCYNGIMLLLIPYLGGKDGVTHNIIIFKLLSAIFSLSCDHKGFITVAALIKDNSKWHRLGQIKAFIIVNNKFDKIHYNRKHWLLKHWVKGSKIK